MILDNKDGLDNLKVGTVLDHSIINKDMSIMILEIWYLEILHHINAP